MVVLQRFSKPSQDMAQKANPALLNWPSGANLLAHMQLKYILCERHLKYFGLVDDGGKAITFSEWATLAQDRAGALAG